MAAETHKRSVVKAITWRTTGTIDTFLISWLITGHLASASGIAATEVLTKVVLFYLHERAWTRVRWGNPALGGLENPKRSLAKAVSWRTTGTIDTFLISWLITGQAHLAGGIALTEVLTKIVLYYLHERAWARVTWGRTTEVAPEVAGATAPPNQGASAPAH